MNYFNNLIEQGHKILIFGKNGQLSKTFNIAFNNNENIIQLGKQDVNFSNTSSISSIINDFKPTLIFNTSAYTNVNLAENNANEAFVINAEALKVMSEASRLNNSILVHFSTDYIFDGLKEGKYKETDKPNPQNVYGKSKLVGEQNIIKNGCSFFIFRISWLMSEFGVNFIKKIVSKIVKEEDLFVVNDQIGAPISCKLVSQIVVETIAKNKIKSPKHVFHLSTNGKVSWYDIAIHVLKFMHDPSKKLNINPVKSNHFPSNVKRPQNSIFDLSKIEQTLGRSLPFWQDDVNPIIKQICINNNKNI